MLFYGDAERNEYPSSVRALISQKIEWAAKAAPGRERHEALVRAFIAASELVQGLADREFDRVGADDVSEIQSNGAHLLLALGRAVRRSWAEGFAGDFTLADDWKNRLDRLDGAGPIRLKRAEGYAFYCLYPENYLEAAAGSKLSSSTVVIGIRSIGTGLAALVAAALNAEPAYSLRPIGHPFERRVAISAALSARILNDRSCDFAIVDEGPGLSGSSFGSVADWLVAQGVAPRQIHFFPSHRGSLGPHASPAHRRLWETQQKHVVEFDSLAAIRRDWDRLQGWASEIVGERPLGWEDISGGAWRARNYRPDDRWPAVHPSMERRKFLMQSVERTWLVKFNGLDDLAEQRLNAGARLAEAGFVPRHLGAAYGFLVQEWQTGTPADLAPSNVDVIDHVGRYLAFRARHLVAPRGGASLAELCGMAVFNTGEALGPDAADIMRKKLDGSGALTRLLRRVDTDNRLHRWEWLMTEDGRLLKTDAIDHCAAHDLVGCQDIAWDIVGAAFEFGLSDTERSRLAAVVGAEADANPSDSVLRVFELCYLAFQIGQWTHARMATNGPEVARVDRVLKRYADRLNLLLVD